MNTEIWFDHTELDYEEARLHEQRMRRALQAWHEDRDRRRKMWRGLINALVVSFFAGFAIWLCFIA